MKYIIAIVVFTTLNKVFIYTYANAKSNKVEYFTEWEFISYDLEVNFYH